MHACIYIGLLTYMECHAYMPTYIPLYNIHVYTHIYMRTYIGLAYIEGRACIFFIKIDATPHHYYFSKANNETSVNS